MKQSLFLLLAGALVLAGCQTTAGGKTSGGATANDTVSGWSLKKSLPARFRDYGYRVVSKADSHPVRAGEKSIRFEVRAGDCSWTSGWNDCKKDRERHELKSVSWSDREEWYSWSIYLPADWPVVYPVKVALGQFHQEGGHVAWLFQNGEGGYHVDNHTTGETTKVTAILRDADMRGKWSDVLIHARWTDKADGFFRVYVNGEIRPRHSWTGPTKTRGRKVYFKFGVYRSFVSRRDGPEPTQIAYFDEVRRAPTCAGATQFFDCGKIAETPG